MILNWIKLNQTESLAIESNRKLVNENRIVKFVKTQKKKQLDSKATLLIFIELDKIK